MPSRANEAFDEKMKPITQCPACSQESQRDESLQYHSSFEQVPRASTDSFLYAFF